ncbi:MAG: DUF805 domain-containing protein [Pseudomonadota bacterium]
MNWLKFFISYEGRTQRAGYWLMIALGYLVFVAAELLDILFRTNEFLNGYALFESVFLFIILWPSLVITVKRFHDTGRSGWWTLKFLLLSLAPIFIVLVLIFGIIQLKLLSVSFYVLKPITYLAGFLLLGVQVYQFVILAILPGTRGPNDYGPDPLERF